MVDLKQQLNAIDYFGVVAVWLSFFSIIFIISVTCILWCCVSKDDDSTVFAKHFFEEKKTGNSAGWDITLKGEVLNSKRCSMLRGGTYHAQCAN
ncbi:hypothetical protein ANCCAN_16475 [Ancylostoma caninum]|uniref:Uncharacterized protein n=1 Tax=Ancylostoma caninum TaxID=29170 RepID=A0A368FZL4_ANCCA|nr:hypothetical protein ANCCAN_16475 [Ancylostoma caninum]